MTEDLSDLINGSSQLVSPPDVWVKMNELIQDENSSAHDMAEIIQHDPGLTANILKVVNSAFYNLPRQVDTVSRAVAIIGTNDLYNLATAITAAKVFSSIPCHLTSPEIFWRHSIATGILAKKVAQKCVGGERLYVAGLLHDIGSLLLYNHYPEQSSELLMIANGDEEVLFEAENDMFGFNHATVSAELLKLWNMPEGLVSAVEFHHNPAQSDSGHTDAAIIYVANHIANDHSGSAFVEIAGDNNIKIDPHVWTILGLDEQVIEDLIQGYEQELSTALSVMMPSS